MPRKSVALRGAPDRLEKGLEKYKPPRWECARDYQVTADAGRLGAEFLRRNPQFDLATQGFEKLEGPKGDPNSPYRQKLLGVCLQFGIMNPMITPLPWTDRPTAYFERPPYTFIFPEGDVRNPRGGSDSFMLVFDFRQSIERQLSRARRILEVQKAHRKLRTAKGFERVRRTPEEFTLMLRILDARKEKAKLEVIASTLFPDLASASALAKVKDLKRQAEYIRDWGYRYFALFAEPKRRVKSSD